MDETPLFRHPYTKNSQQENYTQLLESVQAFYATQKPPEDALKDVVQGASSG